MGVLERSAIAGAMQSLWNRTELCDSGVVGVFQWSTIAGVMQGLLQKGTE